MNSASKTSPTLRATDDLAVRIARLLTKRQVQFEAKRMMGGICFKVDGKMLAGTARNRLMIRFDPERHDEILARDGAGPMDFTGRAMRGYVFIQPEKLRKGAVLASWLALALDFNPRAQRSKKKAPSSPAGKPKQ